MSNELTDVRCPCGAEFQADSYDAGFIAGSGMCQNCDAAMPPKDIPAPVEQAGGDERVKCAVCVDSGKVYDISGEGPWKCYACTGSHEVVGYANGDELDNMLDDRTAVLSPVKTSFHTVPVYREARDALEQPSGEVVVTKNESGAIVSVTRQDKEGRVLSVIAESQPSPAQAEKAEAERPEVVAYFDRNYPSTGDAFIWSNYEGSPYEPVMTVAQHGRIVAQLHDALDMESELSRRQFYSRVQSILAEAQALREEVAALRTKLAMAEDAAAKGDAARQQCGGMEMEIEELRENAAKFAAFAQEIISGALEGGSFDGADIQESAERHGLIAKHVMKEPCRGPEEYCACAWSTSFPAECYRITAELRALLNQDKENGNG
ncbi:hypothetical protein VXS82_00890 [Pseudomonas aeruginosa]|uniref:hypothetical protein n=1 Tax=Pseudomonas aeruginosa TaxID=287 RepID=UPI002E18387E|nr:hypothetical protein [Pseudomonas aeruginosa]